MSKRCVNCGHSNDDGRIFCSACGEPLDVELRLIQEVEKRKHDVSDSEWRRYGESSNSDDDDYEVSESRSQEKGSALPILLVVLAVVAAAAWFFLK